MTKRAGMVRHTPDEQRNEHSAQANTAEPMPVTATSAAAVPGSMHVAATHSRQPDLAAQHGATTPSVRPLIVTLGLAAPGQQQFEQERRLHFPAKLNRIPAHLSMFHALPGEEIDSIRGVLAHEARREPFPLAVHDLLRLGRGVAYALKAPELFTIHAALRGRWLPWLTRQDLQPFHPHVVIQNKVDPAEARTLYSRLSEGFRPWTAEASSLLLWHYEGGPWKLADEFPFAGLEHSAPGMAGNAAVTPAGGE
ncbi:2'-5' RNA ligase family protein [Acidipila sp. EB88]|uniref:2'-5' RNA ligase family protein n=1 Tax=Acidipila sp. EB88 TaxID=2305226 RepID=UPI000F5FE4C6|nr:2'-5' RNA ligase family protein [Acidipila sp. EB88]RRA47382.1 2'-5' RNA ligase family protein [Acidipila sp. EB88]